MVSGVRTIGSFGGFSHKLNYGIPAPQLVSGTFFDCMFRNVSEFHHRNARLQAEGNTDGHAEFCISTETSKCKNIKTGNETVKTKSHTLRGCFKDEVWKGCNRQELRCLEPYRAWQSARLQTMPDNGWP